MMIILNKMLIMVLKFSMMEVPKIFPILLCISYFLNYVLFLKAKKILEDIFNYAKLLKK